MQFKAGVHVRVVNMCLCMRMSHVHAHVTCTCACACTCTCDITTVYLVENHDHVDDDDGAHDELRDAGEEEQHTRL